MSGFGLLLDGCVLPVLYERAYTAAQNSVDSTSSLTATRFYSQYNNSAAAGGTTAQFGNATVELSLPNAALANGFWIDLAAPDSGGCLLVETAADANGTSWLRVAASAATWSWGGARLLLPGRQTLVTGRVVLDARVCTRGPALSIAHRDCCILSFFCMP